MTRSTLPKAIVAKALPPRSKASLYPSPFAERMEGRSKVALGDPFGIKNFGVNLTRLQPGAITALRHSHAVQDEFVYVLEGHPTLHHNDGSTELSPGMCAGNVGGQGDAQQLENQTDRDVVLLEIGDRLAGDSADYPDDDLRADMGENGWVFSHKDGTPY